MRIDTPGMRATSRSLATILALVLIGMSIIVLFFTTVPQLLASVQSQEQTIETNQRLITGDAAIAVRDFITQRFRILTITGRVGNLATSPESAQIEALQRLLGLEPSFLRLAVFDEDGATKASVARLSSNAEFPIETEQLSELLAQSRMGREYFSQVTIDPLTSEPQVIIAAPLTDVFGETQGALAAVMNLKFMWELVDRLDVGEGGLVYVVDRQGNLLAFSDTARVLRGDNVAHIQGVQEFMQAHNNHDDAHLDRYTGILGADVVGSHVDLGMPDWGVVTETPWLIAYRGIINNIGLALGVLFAVILVAGVAGVIIARRINAPLVALMDTANRIAGGERDVQVDVRGAREIVALGHAFNSMTGQLRQTLEGLEQRVAQRTVELEAALTEVEARVHEQARLLEENSQQREAIRELSVPVLPITDDTLVMPLIGAVDSERLMNIQERALRAIERTSARHLLLDITGVPVVDSQVAQGLLAVAQMTRMLGAEVVLIGIRPEVAQTIVGLGLDLKSLRTAADLQSILYQFRSARATNGVK